MKILLLIAWFASPVVLFAQDPQPPPVVRAPHLAPRAWLGVGLIKPDASITAHLPALPLGIGFVIRSIEKDGPGQSAGLQEFDVVWKINDQLLVNEAQLAALLRLFKPGDDVTLSGYRAGKEIDVKLQLGEAPAFKRPFPPDFVESSVFSGDCNGPRRDVNIGEKTASYFNDEGRAVIRKDGEIYKVTITGPKEEMIYEGDIPSRGDFEKIPDGWRHRIYALRRGLDLALSGGMTSVRQPRPRVVPPVTEKP